MNSTDPIADFLTVLRNAGRAKKEKITVPSSKMLEGISRILKEEQYIEDFKVIEEEKKRFLRVHLKYEANKPRVRFLGRISKPGRREYVSSEEIPLVLGGYGISILSTPKGILSGKKAKEQKIGGELLAKVW